MSQTVERTTYVNRWRERHYTQRKFWHVVTKQTVETFYGLQTINPDDELFYPKGHRRWFNCPDRKLIGILLARALVVRKTKWVRKD